MGAHKKPKALRELHGTANRNKHRDNGDAPEPDRGIGPAPSHFSEEQQEVWDYLVSNMFTGVLGNSDRPSFELLSVLFWRFRFGTYDKEAVIPALNGAELSRLDSLMGRYGMTPADRSKVTVKEKKEKSRFDI